MANKEVLFSSKTNEWYTPPHIFEALNERFNFTLDPCATPASAKCEKFYTLDDNGLEQDWSKDICFVNPPYGRQISKWIEKAQYESTRGAIVVMLIPARTETKYWHKFIWPHACEIKFIEGRIKFLNEKMEIVNNSTIGSAIVVFDKSKTGRTVDTIKF